MIASDETTPSPAASLRAAPVAIATAIVFVSAGYFLNDSPGWNVNSQFALTAAIVERGELSIDAYHDRPEYRTGDKAFFDGRYYCDKSPVTAFLGLPFFFLYRAASGEAFDVDVARRLTTWGAIGGSAALFAALLAVALVRRGVGAPLACAAAALWILATPLFGYATVFYNYLPAAAMALGGWLLIEREIDGGPPAVPLRSLASGFLFGLAVWTLPTFGLLAAMAGIALIARAGRGALRLWPWGLGVLLGVAGFAVYSLAIFGQIASPYRFEADENFRVRMSQGLMGATRPDARVLWLITLHPFRGLFTLFPATLLALTGLIAAYVDRSRFRLSQLLAALFLLGLLLYNSGYYMWWGGWAYAPRHLLPAVALLGIGLAPWMAARRAAWRSLALFILAGGAMTNTLMLAHDPQLPPGLDPARRLSEAVLYTPEFVPEWPLPNLQAIERTLRGEHQPNWGTALGLRGAWSLAPLAAIWAIGFAAIGAVGGGSNRQGGDFDEKREPGKGEER